MMTPLKKEFDHTVLRVQRASLGEMNGNGVSDNGSRHVAGGQHQGIIINKQLPNDAELNDMASCDLRLSFKVFLINAITQIHQQESRELRFWFAPNVPYDNGRLQCAQAFFRALVNPSDFPKTYVGFIMKLMKTMQQIVYRPLQQIELEVRMMSEPLDRPPSHSPRPCKQQTNDTDAKQTLPDLIPIKSDNKLNLAKQQQQQQRSKWPPPIPPKPKRVNRPIQVSIGLFSRINCIVRTYRLI